jgi:N-acetylneuraminic acid mutarotase
VGDKIYVLGGWVQADKRTLDSILCYDINSNKWSEAGKLCHAVRHAACVTYKHYVYVFGGLDKDDKRVNHVQVYDTTTRNVSLASNPMPAAYKLMRAVLWRSKALLIGRHTCYIYDFESSTWQERKRFKTGVIQFGLTLDNNTLYITGGGTCSAAGVWTCRADVKSLIVNDFISDNKDAEWKHFATLPTSAFISAYSPVPLMM